MVSRGSLLFFKSVGQGSRSSRGAFRVQRTLVLHSECRLQIARHNAQYPVGHL